MTQREDPKGRDSIGGGPQAREEFSFRGSFSAESPTLTLSHQEQRASAPRPHGAQQPGGPCRGPAAKVIARSPRPSERLLSPKVPTSPSFRGSGAEDRGTALTVPPTAATAPTPRPPTQRRAPVSKSLFLLLQHSSASLRGNPSHLPLGMREPRTPSSGEARGGACAQSGGLGLGGPGEQKSHVPSLPPAHLLGTRGPRST